MMAAKADDIPQGSETVSDAQPVRCTACQMHSLSDAQPVGCTACRMHSTEEKRQRSTKGRIKMSVETDDSCPSAS